MKRLILILIAILAVSSCSGPRFLSGTTTDIRPLIDSLQTADQVQIPDIDTWIINVMQTNIGRDTTFMWYQKVKRNYYILTIDKQDSVYYYRYRVE